MQIIIPIIILIVSVVLFFKVTKAILKAAFAFLFVGFVVYLVTGTDLITQLLNFLGV